MERKVLGWMVSQLGKISSQGLLLTGYEAIHGFLQERTETTQDIQAALQQSYTQALGTLEIAIKGPAIWAKMAQKEFSLSFEAEVMEPFCQKFSAEEELKFRQDCLRDLQLLKKSSGWGKVNGEEIAQAFSLGEGILGSREKMSTAQQEGEVELRERVQKILPLPSALLELLQFRNILLEAVHFQFRELVKKNERLYKALDLSHKKRSLEQMAENQREVSEALAQIADQQERLWGGMRGQFQELVDSAREIELTAAHLRQDCRELKAGQQEILCGLEMIRQELRTMGQGHSSSQLQEMQAHRDFLAREYALAREGYQALAQSEQESALKYRFWAMAASLFQELRRSKPETQRWVTEFQSFLAKSANSLFPDCQLIAFFRRYPLSLRFQVKWRGQPAELIILSPLLALRKNSDVRTRFLRTPLLLERLAALPFLPRLLEVNPTAEIPYYLTEWRAGQTLAQMLKENPPSTEGILHSLARMLNEFHEQEVVLRTLDLHEILYTPQRELCLHGLEMAKDRTMSDLTQSEAGLSLLGELPQYSVAASPSSNPDLLAFGRAMAYLCTRTECPGPEAFPHPALAGLFVDCLEPNSSLAMAQVVERLAAIQNPPAPKAYVQFEVLQGSKPNPDLFEEHDTLVVGRGDETGCRILADPYASRIHCVLEMNPPQCLVKDLGSRNGTMVNGKKQDAGRSTMLREGDVLKIGHTLLKVHLYEPVSSEQSGTLGDEVPEYEQKTLLAQEGVWQLYRAWERGSNRWVRLKVAANPDSFSSSRLRRFLAQMQHLQKLAHPHLAQYYAGGYDGRELHLATEWVEGKTLWDTVKTAGPLSLTAAQRMIEQLFETLQYLHGQGMVHRRLHPKNLYLVPPAGLKMMDLGLALHFEMSGLSGLSLYDEKEEDLLYQAPEQIRDYRKIDPRSDIYSAGAVFFYLLTGQPVIEVGKNQDPMSLVLDEKPAPIKGRIPKREGWVEKLIGRCLEKDVSKRFQKVEEVLKVLSR